MGSFFHHGRTAWTAAFRGTVGGSAAPDGKRSQAPIQGLTPLASWVSEIELQRELNEPWIVRSLREAEGARPVLGGNI